MNEIVAKPEVPPLDISTSKGFPAFLADNAISLAFTSYNAGKTFFVGLGEAGKLSIFERSFDVTRGIKAGEDGSLVMASQFQIWRLENALAPGQSADGFDRLYVPQVAYTTGDLRAQDVAVSGNGTIVFVNSLFSCLATVSDKHSFAPIWRPPFISESAPEDRCRLLGLAMDGGVPKYVTAAAATDTAEGWRDEVADGGCVIDAQKDDVLVEGLSLPTAPRLHKKKLYLHEAGSGFFGTLDVRKGKFEQIAFCPGFLRGLDFVGDYAIATTSKSWEGEDFSGLPLEENLTRYKATARCALLVIDLRKGELVDWLRLEGVVGELFDVAILKGVERPAAIGLRGDDIRRILSIAPEKRRSGGTSRGGAKRKTARK